MVHKPHIHFTIQLDWYSGKEDASLVVPLDEFVIRKAAQVLDHPSPNADPFAAAVFCTPRSKIDATEIMREKLSDHIGKVIAAEVLRVFRMNDTEMGYKRAADNGS